MTGKKKKPEPIGDVLQSWIDQSGIAFEIANGLDPYFHQITGSVVNLFADPQQAGS